MKTVIIATATFYKSHTDVRFQCAMRTVAEAKRCGYPIVVVDGSPGKSIAASFHEAGAIVFRQESPGMGASRREAVRHTFDMAADVIAWLEPEKYPLVPLLKPCIDMVVSGRCNLVVPRRFSLGSYPTYQQWSELTANWHMGGITGRSDLDLMFGPRVMDQVIADLFLGYDGRPYGDNWESIFIVVLRALARGYQVGSSTVDYVHPPEQTAIEATEAMDRLRDTQRETLVAMMAAEAKKLIFGAH